MHYKSYLYDKRGNKKTRNQRKQDRYLIAQYNQKLHCARNKKKKRGK